MKLKISCIALLVFPAMALACVNTRNSDFCISYKDITQKSGDHELNLARTYNSQASEIGWFGYGWETPFEIRMTVMPDGSVVVHEYGAEKISYYAPKEGGALQAGVDKIVAVAIQQDKLDPEAAAALRKQLLANEKLRRTRVMRYGIQTQLPIGGIAQSSTCAAATVTRMNGGYRRATCGRGIDYFDLEGRLIRHEENGYKLTIHYEGRYPDRIEDSFGQKLLLKWTAAGHIAEAKPDKATPVVTYDYDDNGNLRHSSEAGGDEYRYEYDGNHNMTQIGYTDRNNKEVQYDEKDRITSVSESDGSKATYTYRYDPNNPSFHYWVTIIRTGADGEQSIREDEFLLTIDAAGVEQLARMIRTEGGRKQDIVFDGQGRIQRVQKFDGGFSEYIYHPTLNKISMVFTEEGSTVFKYDDAGDLIHSYNSQGQSIRLYYNTHKHIIRMVENNRTERTRHRDLTFEYNAQGKPTKITMIGKGTINVEYDEQGEISKVESKQGSAMALEVTMAFQALLRIAKAGGVDFCI